MHANANANLLQSCLTLCDPIDGSPPGSAVPGILQARTLEWVAISFSNAWKKKVKVKSLSRVQLLESPWTAAYQAPLSMDFPGKSTGVGCHCLHNVIIQFIAQITSFLKVNFMFGAYSKTQQKVQNLQISLALPNTLSPPSTPSSREVHLLQSVNLE